MDGWVACYVVNRQEISKLLLIKGLASPYDIKGR